MDTHSYNTYNFDNHWVYAFNVNFTTSYNSINTRRWSNAGSILVHSLVSRPNIKPALGQRLVFPELDDNLQLTLPKLAAFTGFESFFRQKSR